MVGNYLTWGVLFDVHWRVIRQFISMPFIAVAIVNVIPLPFYALIRLTTGNRKLAINWFVNISYCISSLLFLVLLLSIMQPLQDWLNAP